MSPRRGWIEAYFCGLLASAVMLPGVAGAFSVALYLGGHRTFLNRSGPRSWVFGIAIAVGLWFVLAPLLRRYAFPSRAIPSVYDELRAEYDELQTRYESLADADKPKAAGARVHLADVASELGLGGADARSAPGLRWTLATGYVAVWNRLHRAREELLTVVPIHEVVETAMEYRTRLQGSTIANADGFVRELELAILRIDPGMAAYLDADRPPRAAGTGGQAQPALQPSSEARAADSPEEAIHARLVVRRITRAIHEYRDSRRGGIIRSRNRLFATVIFAGATTNAVLGLALVQGSRSSLVAAGVAYYLIGGVIGLFQQLRAASAADTVTEEDYGLSTARLIHTPLFSGIAGVAGVALAVLAPVAAPGKAPAGPASLNQVFDLAAYPAGVVVAAVFGLTPSLLITRLQKQAEQYKADLRGSEAGEAHAGSSAESSA